jgi:hypothetical protein
MPKMVDIHPLSFILHHLSPIPYDYHLLTNCIQLPYNSDIRRPLPSLGLRGAAPGITVGVRHGLWLHQCQLWLPRAAASVFCQWLRNWCSFSGRRPSRTAMGPAKLFLSAFETATSHVLAARTTLRCTFWRPPPRAEGWCQDVPSQARKHYGPLCKHHGPRWPKYTALRPCKLFSIGFRNCCVARFRHPLKASKAQKTLRCAFRKLRTRAVARSARTSWHVLYSFQRQPRPKYAAKTPQRFPNPFKTSFKPSAAAFEVLPMRQHGTSLGPANCFYGVSKLLRGRF